jgi:hypothetical protein
MLIKNQDHDAYFVYNPQKDQLIVAPVGYNKILFGWNVYLNDIPLGIFDSEVEALREVNSIVNCPHEIYIVNGHADWEVWEEIKEVMSDE